MVAVTSAEREAERERDRDRQRDADADSDADADPDGDRDRHDVRAGPSDAATATWDGTTAGGRNGPAGDAVGGGPGATARSPAPQSSPGGDRPGDHAADADSVDTRVRTDDSAGRGRRARDRTGDRDETSRSVGAAVDPPSGAPTRFGGSLAVAAAVAVALLAGATAGATLATLAAVTGGGAVAGAIALASDGRPGRRALASVATLAGVGAVLAGIVVAGSPAAATLALAAGGGVGLAGAAAVTRPGTADLPPLIGAAIATAAVTVPALVIAVLVHQGLFRAVGGFLAVTAVDLATLGPFVGLLLLQAAGLVAAALLDRALPTLERYASADYERPAALDALRYDATTGTATEGGDVAAGSTPDAGGSERAGPSEGVEPAGVVGAHLRVIALFGAQLFLLVTGWGPAALDWLLTALGPFGGALRTGLGSGLLLAPVAVAAGLLGAIVLAERLREPVTDLAGRTSPQAVAAAAAGLLAVGLTLATGIGPVGDGLARVLEPAVGGDTLSAVGVGTVLLALTTGLALAAALTWVGITAVALVGVTLTASTAGGFGAAATLVGAATVAAAQLGAPAPAVFLGVMGAMVVWDVGHNAVGLGRLVGRRTDSARAESVHAGGTLAAGLVGVGLAATGAYLVGPLGSVPGPRALVALTCTLIALVAFALVGGRDEEEDPETETHSDPESGNDHDGRGSS